MDIIVNIFVPMIGGKGCVVQSATHESFAPDIYFIRFNDICRYVLSPRVQIRSNQNLN